MLARDEKNEEKASADYVAHARALVPPIEAAADRIEVERRIVPDVVSTLPITSIDRWRRRSDPCVYSVAV